MTHRSWGLPGVILVLVGGISFWLQYFLMEKVEKPVLHFFEKLFRIPEETAAKIVFALMAVISFAIGVIAAFNVLELVNRFKG